MYHSNWTITLCDRSI